VGCHACGLLWIWLQASVQANVALDLTALTGLIACALLCRVQPDTEWCR
jgi:hypothetical protein